MQRHAGHVSAFSWLTIVHHTRSPEPYCSTLQGQSPTFLRGQWFSPRLPSETREIARATTIALWGHRADHRPAFCSTLPASACAACHTDSQRTCAAPEKRSPKRDRLRAVCCRYDTRSVARPPVPPPRSDKCRRCRTRQPAGGRVRRVQRREQDISQAPRW